MPPTVVKVKMPESPPYAGGTTPATEDLVWIWDVSAGVLRQAPLSDLPFGTGGGGGEPVVSEASPFMVFSTSGNYAWDEDTNTVKISDTRLRNRTLYPVFTTQYGGGEFQPGMISYNPIDPDDESGTKGLLQIAGFQLDPEHHITIVVAGSGSSSDTSYAALQADVALLKQMMAPFKKTATGANGGKVWWIGPADTIPAGWQECEAMRGLFPMAQDPDDAAFNGVIGTTGGAKDVKLVKENIPELDIERPKKIPDVDRGGGGSQWSLDDIETAKVGTPDDDMQRVNIINPHAIGQWIEFVGI